MNYKLAFASQCGNSGKSVLAASLAVYLKKTKRWPVTLVDLDIEHHTARHWHENRAALTLKPLPDLLEVNSVAEALRQTKADHTYIFDCPSRATTAVSDIAAEVHKVVVTVTPGEKDADLALDAITKWNTAGTPLQRFLVVMTRQQSDSELRHWRNYLRNSSINGEYLNVLSQALPEKVSYRAAFEGGFTITNTEYDSLNQTAARLLKAITEEVTK